MLFSIPNSLSLLRLLLAPLLLALAWFAKPSLFLVLFVAALLSDALDGWLARRLAQTSELGSRLDSWGDLAIFLPLPLEAWWLWPDLVLQEISFIAVAVSALILPILAGLIKFRRLTSYHTIGAKIGAVLLAVGIPLWLIGGPAWPFRLAVIVFTVAETEELMITLRLKEYRSNINSIWHLLAAKKP